MENVPQLLGSFEHGEIVGTAESMGFKVRSAILCAADYGVPQTRKRAIIIGSKNLDPEAVFPPIRNSPLILKRTDLSHLFFAQILMDIYQMQKDGAQFEMQ